MFLLRRLLSLVDPEASPPAATSVVGAVMVVFGGAATLLLLVFCYRRYHRLLTARSLTLKRNTGNQIFPLQISSPERRVGCWLLLRRREKLTGSSLPTMFLLLTC